MNWGIFFATACIIGMIVLYEWPKLKNYPKKDKTAFIVLIIFSLCLSLFNLPYIEGPIRWIQYVLQPFVNFVNKELIK
ncbi:hypothetical protein [Bacillus sp. S/N-304-OC-R1]|uniref:hypothetical protein n=1 Tax=Bacillus sp. S/N-304-OC-R1 TaxID=2758034 RepID=UPI001C8D8E3B|nr:hypothetical protein [Bacillus sp. S/N-304-OC-R1]MBY0120973.1 hypothetical protein [Bacillus sp. S/N-304-OC-R1]